MSTATAEKAAVSKEYRVFRERVDGNGRRWDPAEHQHAHSVPVLPASPWPFGSKSMSREEAIAKIKAEQEKFSASGYDKQLDAYWARNEADRNGALVVWRWRVVDWS